MIIPGTFDMRCWQGVTWSYDILWEDGDPVSPVNLTGYSARMQVRAAAASDDIVLELDSGLGGEITLGGAAGTIDLNLTATATAEIPAGWYVYDLELVSGATVTRLLEGRFAVSAEVTR